MATPPALRSVTVILRSDCTLRCSYCYQRAGGALRMSWPVLRASLDLLATSPAPVTVEFSGGEPLLAFGLIQRAVRHVERSNRASATRYAITTNGTLLGPATLAFLDEHGFEVRLSYHAAPNARDRAGRAVFHGLDELLDRLRSDHAALWRDRLGVSLTVGVAELRSLADRVQYLVDKGLRHIGLSAAFGQDANWGAADLALVERQFTRLDGIVRACRETAGTIPLTLYRKEIADLARDRQGDEPCAAATGAAITVDPTGQVYGCVMMAGARAAAAPDGGGGGLSTALPLSPASPLWAFKVGNVRARDVAERLAAYPSAVEAARIFEGRRTLRSSYAACGTCRFLARCRICPVARAFDPHRSNPRRVSEYICAFNRVAFAHADRFPPLPTVWDQLAGRAKLPLLVRQLRRQVRAADSGRAALPRRRSSAQKGGRPWLRRR